MRRDWLSSAGCTVGALPVIPKFQDGLPPALLHVERNALRALPWRPLAFAWSEQAFDMADLAVAGVGLGAWARQMLEPSKTANADNVAILKGLMATLLTTARRRTGRRDRTPTASSKPLTRREMLAHFDVAYKGARVRPPDTPVANRLRIGPLILSELVSIVAAHRMRYCAFRQSNRVTRLSRERLGFTGWVWKDRVSHPTPDLAGQRLRFFGVVALVDLRRSRLRTAGIRFGRETKHRCRPIGSAKWTQLRSKLG